MAILLQLLSPRIRNSIASSCHGPDMYAQSSSDLHRLFGDRNAIIDTHTRSLLNIAPMKGPGKNEAERIFFDVHRAVSALRVNDAEEELRSRATLQTVASMLPGKMQYGWAKRCYKLHPKIPTLLDMDRWLEELVTINNSLEYDDSESRDRLRRTTVRSRSSLKVLTSLRKDDDSGGPNTVGRRDVISSIRRYQRCWTWTAGSKNW
ncbi:hypothetical protein M513_09299 [Trichuris suis]|uniref:Uncharacterized protein n=1 Tax=Trichuris suis TaxID=68888 RepID=A0A085LXY6_9BILA|nr:hypothetical protein M513_09299 [Trichuris suis]